MESCLNQKKLDKEKKKELLIGIIGQGRLGVPESFENSYCLYFNSGSQARSFMRKPVEYGVVDVSRLSLIIFFMVNENTDI